MEIKQNVSISKEDIKTLFSFKKWIERNTDVEENKIENFLINGVIDEVCKQVKESRRQGSGEFCAELQKLKERI